MNMNIAHWDPFRELDQLLRRDPLAMPNANDNVCDLARSQRS